MRRDLERSLRARSTSPDTAARTIEDQLKRAAFAGWRAFRRHPYLGTAAVGVAAVALASSVGVAELGFGAIASYAAFQVLRGREHPEEAVREVLQGIEHVA